MLRGVPIAGMANDDSFQLHPLQMITLRMLSERSSRGEQQEIAEMMADLEQALVEPQGQPAWKVALAQIQQHIGCALAVAHSWTFVPAHCTSLPRLSVHTRAHMGPLPIYRRGTRHHLGLLKLGRGSLLRDDSKPLGDSLFEYCVEKACSAPLEQAAAAFVGLGVLLNASEDVSSACFQPDTCMVCNQQQ